MLNLDHEDYEMLRMCLLSMPTKFMTIIKCSKYVAKLLVFRKEIDLSALKSCFRPNNFLDH
jgi:hypothetical protein